MTNFLNYWLDVNVGNEQINLLVLIARDYRFSLHIIHGAVLTVIGVIINRAPNYEKHPFEKKSRQLFPKRKVLQPLPTPLLVI